MQKGSDGLTGRPTLLRVQLGLGRLLVLVSALGVCEEICDVARCGARPPRAPQPISACSFRSTFRLTAVDLRVCPASIPWSHQLWHTDCCSVYRGSRCTTTFLTEIGYLGSIAMLQHYKAVIEGITPGVLSSSSSDLAFLIFHLSLRRVYLRFGFTTPATSAHQTHSNPSCHVHPTSLPLHLDLAPRP